MNKEKTGKPLMAFIDHSFHKNTKSGDFLRELFAENFIITDYWDNSWMGEDRVPVEEINKYDYVFYFQVLNPFKELKKITAKIIWAPMYDGIGKNNLYWKKLSLIPLKIISFSEKVSHYCCKFKIESLKVKYYKNPEKYNYNLPKEGKHLFFWYRGNIKFSDLKKVLDPSQIDSLTIRSNPDPGYAHEDISQTDLKEFKIKIVNDNFISTEAYFDMLAKANIFISPRKKEGIGMSFLEALAMGMCIIANNEATMNEYLKNGENGYLFNLNNGQKINLSHWEEVRENSKKLATEGYGQWLKDKEKINNFISSTFTNKKTVGIIFQLNCLYLFSLENFKKIITKATRRK